MKLARNHTLLEPTHMFLKLSTVSLRSALLVGAALISTDAIALAQTVPPTGGQGGQGGQRRQGGGMGNMGRGMQDFTEALQADFTRGDIKDFVTQLQLTEDQSGVLETLIVDYEAQYQPEVEAIQSSMSDIGRNMMQSVMTPERQDQMRATWEDIQKDIQAAEATGELTEDARRALTQDRMAKAQEKMAASLANSGIDAELKAAMGEILEKLEAWQMRKAALRKDFTAGMKVILEDEQLALWPAFDRFLTREKTLPRSRISGESINLFAVVDELRLPPAEFGKIEPMFNDYETRLDLALKARNAYIEESMTRLFKAVKDADSSDAERIFKRTAELRAAVRDVNEEFRTAMVGALATGAADGTTWSKQLDTGVLESGWNRIYRTTGTDTIFEAAMKIEALDPTLLQSIVDLYGQYRMELSPMNERLKVLARTEEPDQIVRDGTRFVDMISQGVAGFARNMGGGRGGFGGQGQNANAEDPTRKLFDERSAMGERYQDRLKGLLTPEQWDALPKGRGQGGRGQAGQGGFGGGNILDRIPEEQRKAFLDKVDTNKNGQVDEEEREAVRQYMRDQFGGGAGGAGGGMGGGRGGRGGNPAGGSGGGAPEV